ncbi:MAG: hypothetical protein RBS73_09975 [Prolixibacteraceae bacterium]|jgi:hypothetical protein|nr:hypothetical protein [Prolixibacteraceae bacterium]
MNEQALNHTKIVESGNQDSNCFPACSNFVYFHGAVPVADLKVHEGWYAGNCPFPGIRKNRVPKTSQPQTVKAMTSLPLIRLLWLDWKGVNGRTVRFSTEAATRMEC